MSTLSYSPFFYLIGYYRVNLRSDSGDVLSQSNTMLVSWGDYYHISSAQQSIFPCVDQLVVEYTRPKCVTRADNVHMYAVKTGKVRGEVRNTHLQFSVPRIMIRVLELISL